LLRETAYWNFTSGAAGYMYGNHYTWTSSWPGDQAGRLDTPGAAQIAYVNALLSSISWWNLVPDQNHAVVTAGYGTYTVGNSDPRTNTYCSTAWIPDGSASLTYCPNPASLTVALSQFHGPVTARWYDPAAGIYSAISGSPFSPAG